MAWLSGWSKRIKITIDCTNIDSDKTWFPITVFLGTSVGQTPDDVTAIFDEVGANSKKIAVTKSDGTTELYVEIEQWDPETELAVLHISRDGWTVTAASATEIYIYYDNTHADNTAYVGDICSRTEVWDSNFKFVCHMVDDVGGNVDDSTSNNSDGTKKGANEPIEIAGKIYKGQDFDGDDYINLGNTSDFDFDGAKPYTIEALINCDTLSIDQMIISKYNLGVGGQWRLWIAIDNLLRFSRETEPWDLVGNTVLEGARYYHVAGRYDGINGKVYLDGGEDGSAAFGEVESSSVDVYIGCLLNNSVPDEEFYGIIDEVRISNVARTAAWIKATYYSTKDDLLTFGSEETAPSVYIPKVIMVT